MPFVSEDEPIPPLGKKDQPKSMWDDEDVDDDNVKESWEDEDEPAPVWLKFYLCLSNSFSLSIFSSVPLIMSTILYD